MIAWLMLVIQVLMIFGMGLCSTGSLAPDETVTDQRSVKSELEGRSFRQFHPAKDANPRKAVILDFSGPFVLWAQYAEEGHAVSEWEIRADDYRVSGSSGGSEVLIHLENPQFPVMCENCVDVGGISISMREVFDSGEIAFRIDDPEKQLPSPFPVFYSWTRFNEDEVVD